MCPQRISLLANPTLGLHALNRDTAPRAASDSHLVAEFAWIFCNVSLSRQASERLKRAAQSHDGASESRIGSEIWTDVVYAMPDHSRCKWTTTFSRGPASFWMRTTRRDSTSSSTVRNCRRYYVTGSNVWLVAWQRQTAWLMRVPLPVR